MVSTHRFSLAKASADTLGQAKVDGRTGGVGLSPEKGRSCESTRLFQSIDAASPKLDSTLFQSLARPVHFRITPHSWTSCTADMIQVFEETDFFLSSRLFGLAARRSKLWQAEGGPNLKARTNFRVFSATQMLVSCVYKKISNFERWCCTSASFSSMLQI